MWSRKGKVVAISASTLDRQKQGYIDFCFDAFILKSFLPEQIYPCLINLLGVEYQYMDSDEIAPEPLELDEISLLLELIERVKKAGRLYSTTELRDCLTEVEQLGEDGVRLAAYL